jgi:hypothetical protein
MVISMVIMMCLLLEDLLAYSDNGTFTNDTDDEDESLSDESSDICCELREMVSFSRLGERSSIEIITWEDEYVHISNHYTDLFLS